MGNLNQRTSNMAQSSYHAKQAPGGWKYAISNAQCCPSIKSTFAKIIASNLIDQKEEEARDRSVSLTP